MVKLAIFIIINLAKLSSLDAKHLNHIKEISDSTTIIKFKKWVNSSDTNIFVYKLTTVGSFNSFKQVSLKKSNGYLNIYTNYKGEVLIPLIKLNTVLQPQNLYIQSDIWLYKTIYIDIQTLNENEFKVVHTISNHRKLKKEEKFVHDQRIFYINLKNGTIKYEFTEGECVKYWIY